MEAVGFSPELIFSLEDGKLITQPLAGTRSALGSGMDIGHRAAQLANDGKEIVEHALSVKAAMTEMTRLCERGSLAVGPFMEG
jgi:salicylate synthetase